MLQIVPIYTEENKHLFATAVPPKEITVEGIVIHTAPLAFRKNISLLIMSENQEFLANGVMDCTDVIDPAVYVSEVYVSLGDENVVKFDVSNDPLTTFIMRNINNPRVWTVDASYKKHIDSIPGAMIHFLLSGTIDISTGVIAAEAHVVSVVGLPEDSVKLLGYSVNVHRVKRRPRIA